MAQEESHRLKRMHASTFDVSPMPSIYECRIMIRWDQGTLNCGTVDTPCLQSNF